MPKSALIISIAFLIFPLAAVKFVSADLALPATDPLPEVGHLYTEPKNIRFYWTPPTGNPSPIDYYEFRLDTDQAVVENSGATPQYFGTIRASVNPSYRINRLKRDTVYYWRVDTMLKDSTLIEGETWDFGTEPVDIPGIVINYSIDPVNQYLMSPSILILPDGTYIANHEYGGPWSNGHPKQTHIWESKDKGRSWRHIAVVLNQYWSSTFYIDGSLYLMGIDAIGPGQSVTIRRSDDNGYTWTDAVDETSGLLLDGDGLRYHTGPVPVAFHNGRVWRTMEDRADPGEWGFHFRALVMSAPVDSNLLDASNWIHTPPMSHDEANWTGTGWLEGNVVVTPQGELVNILRVSGLIPSLGTVETAAVMHISNDGTTATFDPESGFIDFPGGGVKFVIRFDDVTGLYWTLANTQREPYAMRNRLVLCSSPDLLNWTRHKTVLEHWDIIFHAWQYVDWRIDGDNMVFVSRTAHPMGHGVLPHGYHDANFFTFHKIPDFRDVLITVDDDDDDMEDDDDDNDAADDDDATDDDDFNPPDDDDDDDLVQSGDDDDDCCG